MAKNFDYLNTQEQVQGFDTPESRGLPILSIVDSGSDILDPEHELYIEEAVSGDFFMKQTMQVFHPPLRVVPIAMRYVYSEYKPNMGGFVSFHSSDNAKRLAVDEFKFGAWKTADDNSLLETYAYVLSLIDHEGMIALFNMRSSMIPTAQAWNRSMNSRKLPNGQLALPFHNVYTLRCKREKNTMGSWFSVVPKHEDFVDNDQYLLVQKIRNEMGEIKLIPDDDAVTAKEPNF